MAQACSQFWGMVHQEVVSIPKPASGPLLDGRALHRHDFALLDQQGVSLLPLGPETDLSEFALLAADDVFAKAERTLYARGRSTARVFSVSVIIDDINFFLATRLCPAAISHLLKAHFETHLCVHVRFQV